VTILDPAKLLVVLVVAVIVLGPDKLPKVARQMGSLWGDFRRLRQRLESDVRGNFPDLPSTEKITQAVRSPISFLDSLADTHAAENGVSPPSAGAVRPADPTGQDVLAPAGTNRPNGVVRADEESSIPGVTIGDPQGIVHRVRMDGRAVPDDPSMN
jgi:sec-independent protein translocase protein TatB